MGERDGGVKNTGMKTQIGCHICIRIQKVMESDWEQEQRRTISDLVYAHPAVLHIGSSINSPIGSQEYGCYAYALISKLQVMVPW